MQAVLIGLGSTAVGLFLIYCIIGSCIRYRSGIRGIDAVPHIRWWRDVFRYYCSCCRESSAQSGSNVLPEFGVGGSRLSRIELQTMDLDEENVPVIMMSDKVSSHSMVDDELPDVLEPARHGHGQQHSPHSRSTSTSAASSTIAGVTSPSSSNHARSASFSAQHNSLQEDDDIGSR